MSTEKNAAPAHTAKFASIVCTKGYDALDNEAITAVKRLILDGVAVAVAGTAEDAPKIYAAHARDTGGTPQATQQMMAGAKNGELWEWHTASGWQKVPGSEAAQQRGARPRHVGHVAVAALERRGHVERPPQQDRGQHHRRVHDDAGNRAHEQQAGHLAEVGAHSPQEVEHGERHSAGRSPQWGPGRCPPV